MKSIPIALLLLLPFVVYGQAWTLADYTLIHDGTRLDNGLAGGLNAPQFYHVDVNRDGNPDFLVFDRDGFKTMVFEAMEAGSCFEYVHNQELSDYFRQWINLCFHMTIPVMASLIYFHIQKSVRTVYRFIEVSTKATIWSLSL